MKVEKEEVEKKMRRQNIRKKKKELRRQNIRMKRTRTRRTRKGDQLKINIRVKMFLEQVLNLPHGIKKRHNME